MTAQGVSTVSVTMPKLGESVVEGTVVRWLKREGDPVAKYEPLAEVMTDKVNTEIPSPEAGHVVRLSVEEGRTVAVGAEIAVVEVGIATGGDRGDGATPDAAAAVSAAGTAGEQPDDAAAPRPRTSPLVRRLAKEHDVDLRAVPGTGTGGRVTKDDILAFIEQRPAAGPPAEAAEPATPSQPVVVPERTTYVAAPVPAAVPMPAGPGAPAALDEEVLPATPMRRAIAEHMVRSVTTAPHTWTYVETDVSGLVKWRAAAREEFRRREGFELSYVPFICKAAVETLREHPVLNSTWRDGQVVLKQRINLGVAVALEEGLVVPVIHDADRLSIAGLAKALDDLVTRARAGALRPDDVRDGTFTLNNTGALGSILSQPIINQPQAAIVTMEAITKRVVVLADDAIAVRPIMNVCISFDHRVCDGLQVGRFMQSLKRRIESMAPGDSLY